MQALALMYRNAYVLKQLIIYTSCSNKKACMALAKPRLLRNGKVYFYLNLNINELKLLVLMDYQLLF
jgi:hypothetical protein